MFIEFDLLRQEGLNLHGLMRALSSGISTLCHLVMTRRVCQFRHAASKFCLPALLPAGRAGIGYPLQ